MSNAILYKQKAQYYDLICSAKNYEKESKILRRLIKRYKQSTGNELLDVACGTGKHVELLSEEFSCTGVDLNREMLSIARKRTPKARFYKGEMKSFTIKKTFDVVTSLFSAIGYLKSQEEIRKAIKRMCDRLKPGGVLIIEPWYSQEQYTAERPYITTYDSPHTKIARLSASEK